MTAEPIRWRIERYVVGLVLVLSAVSVTLGLIEIGLWVRGRFAAPDQTGRQYLRPDDDAGWTLRRAVSDAHSPWKTQFTTTPEGWRARYNPGARRRVLVIGDSFTEGIQVDDDSTYAARLAASRHDIEFVVMGVAGYGTLQEVIQFERLLTTGRTDAVIWQVSNNDLVNNDFALERASLWNNNEAKRPYLEDGRVVMRNPSVSGPGLHLSIWRVVAARLRLLRATRLSQRSVEQDLDKHPTDFAHALAVTGLLFHRARHDATEVPMVAFLADREFNGRVLDVAASEGFLVAPVREALDSAVARRENIAATPRDAHWNARGHAIAAQVLLQSLDALLPRDSTASAAGPVHR